MPKTTATVDTSSRSPQISPAISYRLSDPHFLDLGWTTKADVSLAYPVVTMKAKFSHPVISPWFKERQENCSKYYSNGNILYFAKKNGTGKIYYPNSNVAVTIEKGGVYNYRTRLWVNSPGEVDLDGVRRPSQLCALFDSLGHGVVYDHCMNKRLVYNQTEGILWESPSRVPIQWKWHNIMYLGSMSLMNEEDRPSSLIPEIPKKIIAAPPNAFLPSEKEVRNFSKSSSPTNLSCEITKSEIEFREYFEHNKYVNTEKMQPRQVSPIRPIMLQLNRYITLKIWNQSQISLSFYAQGRHTQLKIGILYNPYDKLKVTEVEDYSLGQERVLCPFESFPAKTKSMMRFKEIILKLKKAPCITAPGVTV